MPATPKTEDSAIRPEQQALHEALAQLVASLARLAVHEGLPYAAAEEMLKRAFVDAASAAHPQLPAHRKVSRVAAATGINRREVTRLSAAARGRAPAPAAARRSLTGELFTRWRSHAPYRAADGSPRTLPRQGREPSFETLAQCVTRDVHPRTLLDELCRLGLAQWDAASDTVSLVRDAHVPRGDLVRMLGFLGNNVGDHLRAAVDNVLAEGGPPHLEQALFADGLSAASMAVLRPLLREQWQRLREAVVPELEARIAADAQGATPAQGRIRLGLYTFHEGPRPDGPSPTDPPAPKASPNPLRMRKTRK